MAIRDQETVIIDKGASPLAVIGGLAIVVLIVLGLFWAFGNNNGAGGTVDVDVPAVSVNVAPDGQ